MRSKGVKFVMPRRNFKMKVKVIKGWHDLTPGDILQSVTMRKGQYHGLLNGDFKLKRSIPIHNAEEI